MAIADWLMILAVLTGPVVAVQVNVLLERRREARQRRLSLFRTLMTTRASSLAYDHVQALNMIDVEFRGNDRATRAVIAAWKAYLDHLNTRMPSIEVWGAKREDLFIDLLHTMALSLGYDYDKTHLRRTSYFPQGYGDQERDQLAIRQGLAEVLEGKRWIPVIAATAPSGVPQPLGELQDVQQLARPQQDDSDTQPDNAG